MKAIAIIAFMVTSLVFAQDDGGDKNVIYKYRQYEKFDLGDMSIKGDIITPGDISVKRRNFKIFSVNLYDRTQFDDVIEEDIFDLR